MSVLQRENSQPNTEFSTALTKYTYLILIPNLLLAPEITGVIPHVIMGYIHQAC